MILDTLKNGSKYNALHPRIKMAFEYLNAADLGNLALGKIELDGLDIVVNVVDITGKSADQARMETHEKFIDIQIPIGASETMGWKAKEKLNKLTSPYNSEKDIAFYADKASVFVNVEPYEFIIFFPEDGHQPGIGEGTYKKIIVKIRV
jgi:YhcH/YjgK/YiaL family protein